MGTTKPTATAFRRRAKKKDLTKSPAKGYAPASTGNSLWGALQSTINQGAPLFTPYWIPQMLRDPVVQFGLNKLVTPLTMVQFDIQSPNPEVQAFVENTVKKFWRRSMPLLAFQYFAHGYAPGIHQFDRGPDGLYRYEKCEWVHPPDATALRYKAGEHAGELAGFRLSPGTIGLTGGVGGEVVTSPFAAWYAGLGGLDRFHDHPKLMFCFDPWLEKNTKGGGRHARKLYYRTQAFRGQVIYHPDGYIDPNDPNSGANRDYALYLADTLENGSSLVFPDIRTPGDGRNEPAWRVEPIEGNAAAAVNILEYINELDKEILTGLGIPPEVVEASETGSGYSGRQIPYQTFITSMESLVGPMVGLIEPAVRELVNQNYDGAEFTLDTIPLSDTVSQQNNPNQNPVSAVGGMAPDQAADPTAMAGAGGGGPDAEVPPEQSAGADAGGDPTAGGLVDYTGRRGGRGKKDPRTGRVYYMSHSGARLGCLMADIPEPLASACRSFAATVPADHLTADGRVSDPHVTVRYGLESGEPGVVFRAVGDLGSLAFEPGELRVFENDGEDVLYVACENPAAWHRWHRACGSLPCQDSDHSYEPHLTLAYLKPGKGKLYAGKNVLAGPPVPVATVTYSGPDGRDSKTAVWPSAAELEQAFSDSINLAWTASRSATGNLKAEWDGEGGVQKKSQYGENARRALAGESLIAQRPGEQTPIAEKVGTAKAVPLPKVGPGQKLVRATDYRDGMEPPAADRPRDSLDRDIAAANKPKPLPVAKPVAKRPLPVANRAPTPKPPQPPVPPKPPAPKPPVVAKRAPAPPPPVPPKPPVMAKRPEPPKSPPPPPAKPPTPNAGPNPAAKPQVPPKPDAWEDEFRELQNRHDAGDVPLKPADLKRLNELQAKAGVPEANRVKVPAAPPPPPAPKPTTKPAPTPKPPAPQAEPKPATSQKSYPPQPAKVKEFRASTSEPWDRVANDPDLEYRIHSHPDEYVGGGSGRKGYSVSHKNHESLHPVLRLLGSQDAVNSALKGAEFTADGHVQITPAVVEKLKKSARSDEHKAKLDSMTGMWLKYHRPPGTTHDPAAGRYGDGNGRNGVTHVYPPGVTPAGVRKS